MPKNFSDSPVKRYELATTRIASVTQLNEKDVAQVLTNLTKAIGYYLLKEQQMVMMDL